MKVYNSVFDITIYSQKSFINLEVLMKMKSTYLKITSDNQHGIYLVQTSKFNHQFSERGEKHTGGLFSKFCVNPPTVACFKGSAYHQRESKRDVHNWLSQLGTSPLQHTTVNISLVAVVTNKVRHIRDSFLIHNPAETNFLKYSSDCPTSKL